jgi:hypothetical protein
MSGSSNVELFTPRNVVDLECRLSSQSFLRVLKRENMPGDNFAIGLGDKFNRYSFG